MEIWLDTCNIETINKISQYGILHGVTTNPTILAASEQNHKELVNKLLEIQDGPIAIQVTGETAKDMVKQAIALHGFSDRILIKIPAIQEGLIAMKILSEQEISFLATAVFQPAQAILAAIAGADYIAPYIGRMLDNGIDAFKTLETILKAYHHYEFKTKILAAALRSADQIITCASMGVHAVTLKDSLASEFIADDKQAIACRRNFANKWETRSSINVAESIF